MNAELTDKTMALADHAASLGPPMLAVEGLQAGYRSTQALDDVSFELPRGSLAAVRAGVNAAC